uniref:Integrase catalytic domain-containing protein n=1 Tax=Tanacetum cinerariifolium TaxID=118510 RepID=A0A6L2L3P6_TANCI|nr:hypothetical protein [Tanacetum cinerariifolium]GEW17032.1 hypothetical protein [Tanacetum cinerariifolium]
MDVEIEQDDLNQKFLTSLAPEWLMYTIMCRNRDDLDTLSLDDVYNHLKVYEPEVQKKSESNSQNIAFIFSANTSSGKGEINTASVPTANTQVSPASANIAATSISHNTVCTYIASQSNGSQIKYEDINQIDEDDIKEMDIKWNMALLIGWDWSYMANEEENHALVADDEAPTQFALMSKSSSSSENDVFDDSFCSKACRKNTDSLNTKINKLNEELSDSENTLPSPSIESKTSDLQNGNSFISEHGESLESVMSKPMIKFVKAVDSPTIIKTNKVKTVRKPSVKYTEMYRNTSKSPNVRGNQRNWNNLKSKQLGKDFLMKNKACFKYGHFDHLTQVSNGLGPQRELILFLLFVRGNHHNNIDDKGYWDSGCSRHMTGNISYLSDYEPYDGGYVSFEQGGDKITGKDFKQKDDTNVLLRTPRQHNMYSIDLNNIVPHKNLTCLVAKASADESILWHRRLGHLNFKIMNKLVRHNIVKGLPSKCYENDHTCVACLKGKQHKASCKTNLVNSVSKPLHTLHMDLFGPTSVSSLNHKWYCFVVTDDFSRCDNGGEFKNKEMNDFCFRKEIKREFSNARTPQQNGVAERRNRTLIEAARTMLADAKLPVTFWAEAVNTACYVQNRVLVNKITAYTHRGLCRGNCGPPILAEQFELKHSLINMMTLDQFFRLEKDNPYDHIRAARWWLEKEPPHSIPTWEDLVSKFINEFFPPQEQQISIMKSLFFNNGLMNRFMRHGIDTKISFVDANSNSSSEIAKLTHAVNQQTSIVTTAMTAILKQFEATPPSASVKAVEEIYVTCGGAHPYYQCLAIGGNTFPELRDNIQGYVAVAVVKYNQGNSVYRPLEQSYQAPTQQNQVVPLSELEKVKRMNEANMKAMQTQINNVKNKLRNEMKNSIQAFMSNQTNKLKNMMASFFQMNTASGSGSLLSNTIANPKGELKAITTRSGIVLDGPSIPIPSPFINLEEDECVKETLTNQDLAEYTIKKKLGLPELISTCMTLELANRAICTPARIARDVFVPVGKFTFPADFVIVDYESDPRVPLILGRPFLRTTRALIDVHREEMILRDGDERLTLNMRHDTSSYSNQPQKESINLINVFNDSSEVFLEDLFSTNQPSGNPTFSSHPELTSSKVKNDIFDPDGGNVLPGKLLDLDSIEDLHPPHHVKPLSGSTAYSSFLTYLLEEFIDELALITFPPGNNDLQFDIESDLKEIEYLLHHDPIKDIDSSLKDSIDQSNLADLNDNLVDSMPEMFTDEHALDYSSPPLYDEYDDDLFEVESDTENVYDDPFDSKGEKIKVSKLFIDELDLPCDFLLPSKYDSILSKDFSRVDALPSNNNDDKVFNLGILIQEHLFQIITRVAKDKKLFLSHASVMIEDFDPPLCELPFFKEVPRSNLLLLFLSENKEKVFKPRIHTSGKVHSSLILELSHQVLVWGNWVKLSDLKQALRGRHPMLILSF